MEKESNKVKLETLFFMKEDFLCTLNAEVPISTISNYSNPLLILKEKKFPTNSKKFESKSTINEKKKFSNFFPKTFELISNQLNFSSCFTPKNSFDICDYTNDKLCKAADDMLKLLIRIKFPIIEEEIGPIFGEEWNRLTLYQEGSTKIHTIASLIMVYLDVYHFQSENFSEYDKNILLWTLLLHDIAKHVILNQSLFEHFNYGKFSKDKTHPFKSGAVALKIFQKNGFLENDENSTVSSKVDAIYDLLIDSAELVDVKKSKKKIKNIYIHSHRHLEKIWKHLGYIKEISHSNEWIVDVIILIIFHQSLPNNKDHWNKPILEDEMLKKIFDVRLLELMRIVMINDSAAHSLFFNKSFAEEINFNLDKLRDEIE